MTAMGRRVLAHRPKVLHLTTSDMSLDWLLKPQLVAFASAGFDVVTASADGPHVDALAAAGIEHHAVNSFTRAVDWRSDVGAARELASLFRNVRPDIIHTHNPKPGILGRVIGRFASNAAVVNTVHGLYATNEDALVKRAAVYGVERFAACFSDVELVQSGEDLELLAKLGVGADRLVHLGNGIDLDRFQPAAHHRTAALRLRRSLAISPSAVVVGIVGRMVRQKGYGEFIEAVSALRTHRPNSEVAFVTVGPDESHIRDGLSVSELDRLRGLNIHGLGQRTDMETVYSLFDVLVLPSYREGFPRAAMEANAMGVPVIASNVRGCREVVSHGVNGVLIPARQAEALEDAIRALVDDDLARSRMGRAGQQLSRARFDQQRVINVTTAAYRRVLAERSRAPAYTSASRRLAVRPSNRDASESAA